MALLAGEPFYVSPSELMSMEAADLFYWEDMAYRRLELARQGKGG